MIPPLLEDDSGSKPAREFIEVLTKAVDSFAKKTQYRQLGKNESIIIRPLESTPLLNSNNCNNSNYCNNSNNLNRTNPPQSETAERSRLSTNVFIESESFTRIRRDNSNPWSVCFKMFILLCLMFGGIGVGSYLLNDYRYPYIYDSELNIIQYKEWSNEQPPSDATQMDYNSTKIRNIIITQTMGERCHTDYDCIVMLQQEMISGHDLPENFLISDTGDAYEIRGWKREHGFDQFPKGNSFIIGLIGNYTIMSPTKLQLDATGSLIYETMHRNLLADNFKLYGVQNLTLSHFDGNSYLREIAHWSHFDAVLNVL